MLWVHAEIQKFNKILICSTLHYYAATHINVQLQIFRQRPRHETWCRICFVWLTPHSPGVHVSSPCESERKLTSAFHFDDVLVKQRVNDERDFAAETKSPSKLRNENVLDQEQESAKREKIQLKISAVNLHKDDPVKTKKPT